MASERLPLHPCLASVPGAGAAVPLADAELSDRQRLGVLLEGVGLLAHCERSGVELVEPWRDAVVARGRLSIREPRVARVPGAAPSVVHALGLVDLLWAGSVSSRSVASRTARELRARWSRRGVVHSADGLVEDLLDSAPGLWTASYAANRRALVAAMRENEEGWPAVAGPAAFARAVYREALREPPRPRSTRHAACCELIASAKAGQVWSLRYVRPPLGSRVAAAASLFRQGRLRAARALLLSPWAPEGSPTDIVAHEALRAEVDAALRDWIEAREAVRRGLAALRGARGANHDARLGTDRLALFEIGAIVEGRAGRRAGDAFLSSELVSAGLRADDRGEMVSALLAARVAFATGGAARFEGPPQSDLADPRARPMEQGLAFRASRLAFEDAAARRDLETANRAARRLLGVHRRLLRSDEAARCWGSLAAERARDGDLVVAERWFGRAATLLARCDPTQETEPLAWQWIETMVRRGRLAEAREAWGGDLAGAASGDTAHSAWRERVAARWLLAVGRPETALERTRTARRFAEDAQDEEAVRVAVALEARALGLLGAREELVARMEGQPDGWLDALEVEERPAVLAASGDRDAAFAAASSGPCGALWRAALLGEAPGPESWAPLRQLERYRAARLLVDLEAVHSGSVPLYWRRRAAGDLRRVGAAPFAERLEGSGPQPWRALERYLHAHPGDDTALAALFVRAGYPEARLTWLRDAGGAPRRILTGAGGGEELSAPVPGGRLRLEVPLVDSVLRSLFALLVRDAAAVQARDFTGPLAPDLAPPSSRGPQPELPPAFSALRGRSALLRQALGRAAALAPTNLPVLVLGETGTGKELVARALHAASPRHAAGFVAINCAALSETLVLSDLFGHVRGAFTGAERDRAGVFEAARGGTVFLDEIGDLPASAQGMLLRVLQEGEVRRVGESVARRVDARVVAATHRDLAAMSRDGLFRHDLFFRLAMATVELPPLRARPEDLEELTAVFLARLRPGADGGNDLTPAARAALRAHGWPGNIRELEAALAVSSALAGRRPIDDRHLPFVTRQGPAAPRATPAVQYHQALDEFRRTLVARAIDDAGGNLAEAARQLGLTRQALSYLARRLSIDRD